MKNFKILFVVFAVIAISISCSKDEDKTFEKAMLIGIWEQTAGDDFTACPNGDNYKVEIKDTEIDEYDADDDGCASGVGISYDYSFDGKKISWLGGLGIWEVVDVNATTLKVIMSTPLVPGASKSATFAKQ